MIDSKLILKLVSELDKCVPPQDHLNKDGLIGFFYALAITPIIIPPDAIRVIILIALFLLLLKM